MTECGLGLWYSSRAADSSHSSFPAGFQRRHCEKCVNRIELVRTALVDDDAFPDGRGELWVSSLTILACCGSTPAATAVLNSWKLSVVFENLVVPVHHLGVQRLDYTLLILILLLLLTVQFFGIADVLSTHLFNVPCAYAFQRTDFLDAAVPPKTPSLSEFCSLILQFFLFDLNLGSTPQSLASLFSHSFSQHETSCCFS